MKRRVLIAVVLLALLLCGCKKKDAADLIYTPAPKRSASPAPAPTPAAEPSGTPAASTPTPRPAAIDAELDKIRGLIADERCYEAFRAMQRFEEQHSAPEEVAACETLFAELDRLLNELEPETGTELFRSFTVQGGGVLEVYAFTGPAFVTVTDEYARLQGEENPGAVCFYVRQGERGSVHLPAGTYAVRYQVGYRWFGLEDGFGEYFTAGALDEPLVFDFYVSGNWASNSKYTITL